MHDHSIFATLTYAPEHVPEHGALRYVDYQLFMKKLRNRFGPVRFYMCGEYGDQSLRPHYHACLFGLNVPDRKVIGKTGAGHFLYRSDILSGLWNKGFVSFGDVTFESAAYVARYIVKKVTGEMADRHYRRLDVNTGELVRVPPEFTRMSLKPGIGARWIEKYKSDVYTRDGVVLRGRSMKPPRYYDKYLNAVDWERFDDVSLERFENAQNFLDDCTPERLLDRETVALAGLSFKKRKVE